MSTEGMEIEVFLKRIIPGPKRDLVSYKVDFAQGKLEHA